VPRKKKTANEMTDKELAKAMFPKKVKKALDEIIREQDDKEPNQSSQS
jgi:hypothetical protein